MMQHWRFEPAVSESNSKNTPFRIKKGEKKHETCSAGKEEAHSTPCPCPKLRHDHPFLPPISPQNGPLPAQYPQMPNIALFVRSLLRLLLSSNVLPCLGGRNQLSCFELVMKDLGRTFIISILAFRFCVTSAALFQLSTPSPPALGFLLIELWEAPLLL
jgi:hypothetical protein